MIQQLTAHRENLQVAKLAKRKTYLRILAKLRITKPCESCDCERSICETLRNSPPAAYLRNLRNMTRIAKHGETLRKTNCDIAKNCKNWKLSSLSTAKLWSKFRVTKQHYYNSHGKFTRGHWTMLKQTHSDATVTAATDARALRLVAESIGVVPSSFCQCLTLRPVQAVHTKIYPKYVPIFSCTLSHPVSSGKLLMLSGVLLIQRFTSIFFTMFGCRIHCLGRIRGYGHYNMATSAALPAQQIKTLLFEILDTSDSL